MFWKKREDRGRRAGGGVYKYAGGAKETRSGDWASLQKVDVLNDSSCMSVRRFFLVSREQSVKRTENVGIYYRYRALLFYAACVARLTVVGRAYESYL